MGNVTRWVAGGLTLHLAVDSAGPVRVLGLLPDSRAPRDTSEVALVEIDCAGHGRLGNSTSAQHRPYAVTAGLRHTGHIERSTSDGSRLVVEQRHEELGLLVRTEFEHRTGIPVLRVRSEVANDGPAMLTLTFVSSLALTGFGQLDELTVHEARNAWKGELRWQHLTAEQAGLVDIGDREQGTSKGRHAVTGTGSWSSGDFLPMGGVEHAGLAWVWQVEHNGGWHWELGDLFEDLYLLAGGPTDREHQWRQTLEPGERFTTVPVAVAAVAGDLGAGLRAMTEHRRAIRRPASDHTDLPVIFNDYMNCLDGDATEEKLAPLIDAAAEVGAEYFVIDAGWYAEDGGWWDTVGAWEPSSARFPSGLGATIARIRDAGMAPGLWLEPEVVGVRSPVVDELPEDAFFTDGGRRRAENGRYHLDYRSAAVRKRMDRVVDRLIDEFGVRYFKLDYNVDISPGTDSSGENPGAGLLGHNLAYLAWLDGVLDRHPGLVLENCASGGMRMDYAMLSRLAIQSTSDQTDHLLYVPIAVAAPSAVPPEQGAVWAYPQPEHGPEEASLCLVNALLGRVHLSGRIDRMSSGQLARVRTALDVYKGHRTVLATGGPQWPLGLPGWYDRWLTLAIDDGDVCLLAVWYRGTEPGSVTIPLRWLDNDIVSAEVSFPADLPTEFDLTGSALRVSVPTGPAARLFRLHRRTQEGPQ